MFDVAKFEVHKSSQRWTSTFVSSVVVIALVVSQNSAAETFEVSGYLISRPGGPVTNTASKGHVFDNFAYQYSNPSGTGFVDANHAYDISWTDTGGAVSLNSRAVAGGFISGAHDTSASVAFQSRHDGELVIDYTALVSATAPAVTWPYRPTEFGVSLYVTRFPGEPEFFVPFEVQNQNGHGSGRIRLPIEAFGEYGFSIHSSMQFPGYLELTNSLDTHARVNWQIVDDSRKHLVLVTHGWNGDAADWPKDIANQNVKVGMPGQNGVWSDDDLQLEHLDPQGRDEVWEVVSFDWDAPLLATPLYAMANGKAVGAALGQKLSIMGYESVHFIGHSAGAWLIDAAANQLDPATDVHLTFLDAFTPGKSPTYLGAGADWAEHYVYDSNIAPWTNDTLLNAFNIDVTALEPFPLSLGGHSFPWQWYQSTTSDPMSVDSHNWGALQSVEFQGRHPQYGDIVNSIEVLKGRRIDIVSGKPALPPGSPILPFPINVSVVDAAISNTGTVSGISATGFQMETGSPVWISADFFFEEKANLLKFDYDFKSVTFGLLSVYFEDELIFIAEETASSGLEMSNWLWLGGDFGPGVHRVRFELNPNSEFQSVLLISAIQFAFAQSIPEPSTSKLILGVMVANLMRRRSMRPRLSLPAGSFYYQGRG